MTSMDITEKIEKILSTVIINIDYNMLSIKFLKYDHYIGLRLM